MTSEARLKEAFSKVKEEIEGVKDELAFAIKRMAKLESALINSSFKKIKKR